MRDYVLNLIPSKPYAADSYSAGIYQLPKVNAVAKRHIQLNHRNLKNFILIDVDKEDAYFAPEDTGCPAPNFISINRRNGHGHVGYILDTPVSFGDGSRTKPIKYYEAVRRGLTQKMGGDSAYTGLMAKNPLNREWETAWIGRMPYDLDRLNDYLSPEDKRKAVKLALKEDQITVGRNHAIFQQLSQHAYKTVLHFKKSGESPESFLEALKIKGLELNFSFVKRLSEREVVSVAKSVCKWVWQEFTPGKFSEIQRERAKLRWEGHVKVEPWKELGISERTYYRRLKLKN